MFCILRICICARQPWVSASYQTLHYRTAFTTHCPDFVARTEQREADHRRDSAEQLNRARQRAADTFRTKWESRRNPGRSSPNDGASCCGTDRQQHNTENLHLAKGTNTGVTRRPKPHRPFLRPRWLQFLRQSAANAAAASTATGHVTSSPGAPSVSTETPAAGPRAVKKSTASTQVRKDHVRSVIHLALSEARINAFVVISCLEGLLSVATDGMRPALKQLSRNAVDTHANDDYSTGAGCKDETCTNTSTHRITGSCRADRSPRHASSGCSDSAPGVAHAETNEAFQSEGGSDAATAVAIDSAAGASRGESGAALCVRLGALPAVLGCLNEHVGHKQIEPLAVRLLSVFASDRATSSAIRGNAAVVAACTSRMFPAAAVPAAGEDPSGAGLGDDASGPSSSSSKNTRGADEIQAGGGSRKRGGRAAGDGQSLERPPIPTQDLYRKHLGDHDGMVETSAGEGLAAAAATNDGTSASFAASSVSIPGSFSVSRGGASKRNASTSATTPASKQNKTATDRPSSRTAAPSSPASADRPAAASSSAEELSRNPRGRIPSSESSTPAATANGWCHIRLPPTDLIFVLSEAVRDSPVCQRLVVENGGIIAMLAILRGQTSGGAECGGSSGCGGTASANYGGDGGGARLAEVCLRVMGCLGQPERGRRRLVREGAVETAFAIIGRFRCAPPKNN